MRTGVPGAGKTLAEVGVGHLAGAVDDAAHDGDFYALEVDGGFLDAGGGALEIEKGPGNQYRRGGISRMRPQLGQAT